MKKLPILQLEKFILFPSCESYLIVDNNENLKKTLLFSWKNHRGYLLVIPDKKSFIESADDSNHIGTLAKISIPTTKLDFETILDNYKEIRLIGLKRIKLISLSKEVIYKGEYQFLPEKEYKETKLKELTKQFFTFHLSNILQKFFPLKESISQIFSTKGGISNLIDFIAQNSSEIDLLNKWKILTSANLQERIEILISLTNQKKNNVINKNIERDIEDEEDIYYSKVLENPYPEYVKKVLHREIKKLKKTPKNESSSISIIRQYIEWLIDLPWYQKTTKINSLEVAKKKLDESHYGLTEVKERIAEYLAVQQRTKNSIGQVICFIGQPGVGKTSFATSISEALGREFTNISVEGINDVSEISGHRRTFIGAMPGKIIQAMRKVKVIDPIFVIDEIDKIPPFSSYHMDSAYALLKVFDQKQNNRFIDNYLGEEVPYDLSKVMFICTANDERRIPLPLLDRMEIIHIHSYEEEEKFFIAKKLISENFENFGVKKNEIKFKPQSIREIIKDYTYESGVRELNRKIQAIIRKLILKSELSKNNEKNFIVTPKSLKRYFKKKVSRPIQKYKSSEPGMVTGLAWISEGRGDILKLEAICYPGNGKVKFTGNLGKIMKESAQISTEYIKNNHEKFGIDLKLFSRNNISIHAPEGAIPKDGPSAGIALTTVIISALTKKQISQKIGMTGEITLHGEIIGIGGLREKINAARRNELDMIIIPKQNKDDVKNIPKRNQKYSREKIIMVEKYEEVYEILFK